MHHALDVRPLRLVALVGALVCCALLAVPALAAADDRYVAKDGSDVANDCLDGDAPCLTIGHAVTESADGDRLFVDTGVYTESVTTTKELEFDGAAFSGLPADPGDPDENTIWQGVGGAPALTIDAYGVLVAGFTFGDPVGPTDATAKGISVLAAPDGGGCGCPSGYDPAVTFSTFTHLGTGLQLNSTDSAYIFYNWFLDNDAGSSVAVDANDDFGTFFMQNLFEGNMTAYDLHGSLGPIVAANQSEGDGTFARFDMTAGLSIGFNDISDATADVLVGTGGDQFATIADNLIYGGGGGDGLHLDATNGPMTDGVIAANDLSGVDGDAIDIAAGAVDDSTTFIANSLADVGGAGLRVADADTVVQAADNWWGCNAGPGQPGCSGIAAPGGNVTSVPWTVMTMLDPDPPAIPLNGAESTIGVSFATNSDGQPIEKDGTPVPGIPDGLDIDYTTTLGDIETPGCTCSGNATVTLTSGDTAGIAHVVATLDSQSVDTDVQFTNLSSDPALQSFGSQTVGTTSAPQTFTIQNVGDTSVLLTTVSLQGADASNFTLFGQGCRGATLPVDGTCQVSAVFRPQSAGDKTASMRVSGSGQVLTVTLRGSATDDATLMFDPSLVDFGGVKVGTTSPTNTVQLTNIASRPVTVTHVDLIGPDAASYRSFGGACLNVTLPAGGSCPVGVALVAPTLGPKTAQVRATTTSGPPVLLDLMGAGSTTPPLSFNPSSKAFGTVFVGSSSPLQTFTITNSTGLSVTVLHVELGGADAGDFRRNSGGCLNVLLASGASCTVSAGFAPSSDGAKSAQLTVSTSGNFTQTIALSGTGATAAPLGFTPSTWDFGTVPSGSATATKQFVVTNTSGADVTVGNITFTYADGYTGYFSGCKNKLLHTGDTCAISARFRGPIAAGNYDSQIKVQTSQGSPQYIDLTANVI